MCFARISPAVAAAADADADADAEEEDVVNADEKDVLSRDSMIIKVPKEGVKKNDFPLQVVCCLIVARSFHFLACLSTVWTWLLCRRK